MVVELLREQISTMKRILSLILYGSSRGHKRYLAKTLGTEVLMVSAARPAGVQEQIVGQVIDISTAGLAFIYISKEELTRGLHQLDLFAYEDPDNQIESLPCKVVYDDQSKFILRLPPMRRCGVKFENLSDEQLQSIDHMIKKHSY